MDDRAVDSLPLSDSIPSMATLPRLLGSMYVMEGSTLGGRVIGPQLERQLGLSGGRAYSYFLGHGADTGRLWAEFRRRISESLAPSDHDAAIAAAHASFVSLHDTFAVAQASERIAA